MPGLDPARHRDGVVAGCAKRLRRHRRAHAEAALEDHARVAGDAVRLRREVLELDVSRAGDPARVPLVRLAHVDQQRLAVVQQLGGILDADLDLRVLERTHALSVADPWGATPRLGDLIVHMRRESRPSRVEGRVVAVAARQEGVLAREQMRQAGASDGWIDKRRAMGWLVPVFQGVYGIGHPPRTRRGWYVAALLAGGERSALSHTSAAAVHGMMGGSARLHLSIPRNAKGLEGIRTHRPRALRADDIVGVDGLRVTSPSRTLIDLADFRK